LTSGRTRGGIAPPWSGNKGVPFSLEGIDVVVECGLARFEVALPNIYVSLELQALFFSLRESIESPLDGWNGIIPQSVPGIGGAAEPSVSVGRVAPVPEPDD